MEVVDLTVAVTEAVVVAIDADAVVVAAAAGVVVAVVAADAAVELVTVVTAKGEFAVDLTAAVLVAFVWLVMEMLAVITLEKDQEEDLSEDQRVADFASAAAVG